MSVLTKEDVESAISRSLGPNVQLLEYRLEAFSKMKNGIFGNHQLLVANVRTKASSSKTVTYFVKSPPESLAIRYGLMDQELFHEEINFYKDVYPAMLDAIEDRWSPKCHLVKGEVLVFEDLRSQGYTIREDIPLDESDFLKSSLAALARFHAASLASEAKLGKSLKEAYPKAFVEKMYSKSNKFGKCTAVGYDTIVLMAKRFGMDSSLTQKMYDRVYESVRSRAGKCNVLCHGDLWKNNLLINRDNGTPSCILVDFQLLRYASPACDIGMIIYLHSSPQFRKKFEFEMFDYYYSVLEDALSRSKFEPAIPKYEELVQDYRELRLIGMSYASLYLPGIYLKRDDFELLLNNPNELENWFFNDRMTLIESNMDADPKYEKKIRDIVGELFEEGRRIFDN